MSQFYASIQGNRGMATRQGTKKSGIEGHIRGWNVGARIVCEYNADTDKDTIYVFQTGGSNRRETDKLIARFTEE